MSHEGKIDMDMGEDSASVHGPEDMPMEESGESPPIPMGRSAIAADSEGAGAGTTRRSSTPGAGTSRQRSATGAGTSRPSARSTAPSRIPTRALAIVKKPTRRSPTPTRTRSIVDEQAEAALRSAAALQQTTQVQTQAAMGQADAAFQAARQAVSETATIRQTVEEALARHYHASTTLSTEQVTKLAHETSQEMQMAVQERQQLNVRLQE